MRNKLRKIVITALVIGFFVSISAMTSVAEPTVGNIEITPTQPEQETDVTYSVEISGDNIQEVWIEIEECTDPESDDYYCHSVYNVSTTEEDGTWTVTETLMYSDTHEAHCWPIVLDNGTWYSYKNDYSKWTNFTVTAAEEPDDNGGDVDGDGDDNGGTPGFELVLLMISIAIVFVLYNRKRNK